MSETKNLLHPITKNNAHPHAEGEECIAESLDQSKGHTIRGLVDTDGVHWLAREDLLEFVLKERDTFQKIFGHLAGQGEMHPQYMLAASVLSGLGAILETSTSQENVLVTDFSDEALARLLAGESEKPANPFDGVLGGIADALREAQAEIQDKDNQPPAE